MGLFNKINNWANEKAAEAQYKYDKVIEKEQKCNHPSKYCEKIGRDGKIRTYCNKCNSWI